MKYGWLLLPLGIVLALGGVWLVRCYIRRLVDRRIALYQNDLLARHYDEVQNIYQKMRGWRHDYHNHIQTMKAHLALDQLGELKDYLDILDDDLTSVDTVIKTGNIKLDAILNSKLSLILSKKIAVNAKAQVPENLSINEVDLCVIIGNLLNNALESCERIPEDKERFIRIYIGVLKEQLYISVSNSAGDKVKKLGRDAYLSAKGEGHGFGLKRIDALVEKYGGYLNRQDEPGVFATEIMLPL
jgi:sensor histidine kinase regulating citrate/malate metabolism